MKDFTRYFLQIGICLLILLGTGCSSRQPSQKSPVIGYRAFLFTKDFKEIPVEGGEQEACELLSILSRSTPAPSGKEQGRAVISILFEDGTKMDVFVTTENVVYIDRRAFFADVDAIIAVLHERIQGTVNADSPEKSTGNDENHEVQAGKDGK